MLAIVWLILALVGVVGFFIGIPMTNKGKVQRNGDWTASGRFLWGTGLAFLVIFGSCFLSRCFTTVDAGEVAVQVRFGRVLDRQLENGFNFKDPLSVIYTYGVRLRETTMDIKDSNALEALTSDKLSVLIDATIWWKILPDEPRMIYRYIATDEDRLGELVVFPAIRSAVRDAVVGYSFDDIIPKREELSQKIDEKLIVLTSGKGMKIEMNSGQAGLPMVYSLKDFEKKK